MIHLGSKLIDWQNSLKTKFIEIGFVLIIFLVPLIFTVLTVHIDVDKITLLRLLTLLIIVVWICKGNYSFSSTTLDIPIFFFLTINIFSVFFSVSPAISLHGRYGRFNGFYSLLNYFILYFIFANNISSKRIKKMLVYIIISSLFISIYAIFQHFGKDFIAWEFSDKRSFSTMGHPNFLAAYLVVAIPFILMEFLKENGLKKVIYFLVFLTSFIALLFTYSRSGWVGFLISIFILIIFNLKKILENKRFIFFLFIVLSFLIILFNPPYFKDSLSLSDRFISSFNLKEGSIARRIEIWKTSLYIIRKKPIFGGGVDTFGNFFLKYKKFSEEPYMVADKVHNEFLNITATTGLLGAFAYLWLIISLFQKIILFLLKNNPTENSVVLSSFASVSAYVIQSQFNFGVIVTDTIFWIIVAIIIVEIRGEIYSKKEIKINKKLSYLFAFLILVLFPPFIFKTWLADYNFNKARVLSVEKNIKGSLCYFEKAHRFNPNEELYSIELAELYHHLMIQSPNKEYWLKMSITQYNKTLSLNPLNLEVYYELGNLYEYAGKFLSDEKILKEALNFYKNAISLHPTSCDYHLSLGEIYLALTRISKDKKSCQNLLGESLNAFFKAKKFEPNSAKAFYGLGKVYYYQRKLDLSLTYLKKSKEISPSFPDVYIWCGNIYQEEGKFSEALSEYKAALKLKPSFPAGVHNEIGKTYKNLKNESLALYHFKKALKLSPNYSAAKRNLEELKK